jgi:hypothetical protein
VQRTREVDTSNEETMSQHSCTEVGKIESSTWLGVGKAEERLLDTTWTANIQPLGPLKASG